MKPFPAMILAAGMGNRLRPLTGRFPKPLLPLPGGDTLLGGLISRLQHCGIRTFAVNTHHLGEQIQAFVRQRLKDNGHCFPEENLLGTGGPLINARKVLEAEDAFLLYNADILCDADVLPLMEAHRASGSLATLALIEGPENRVLLDKGNIVDLRGLRGIPTEGKERKTYAGFAVFSTRIFEFLPDVPTCTDIIEVLVEALNRGEILGAYPLPVGTFWSDLGTVPKYLETVQTMPLALQTPPPPDEAHFSVFQPIAEQGSARRFYRLKTGGQSSILMVSGHEDMDFHRFVEFGNFFRTQGCGTPEIYGFSEQDYTVLMEDLGDERLYDAVLRVPEKTEELYRQAVEALTRFQLSLTHANASGIRGMRLFDRDYLRWESQYFTDNLLNRYLELPMNAAERGALYQEFDDLALQADALPKIIMHRDCQSQNIMVCENQIRWVDFQGARLGPYPYDLMSLLYDPYVDLPETVIQNGENVYFERLLKDPLFAGLSREKFELDCRLAGIQRLLQALGCYAFLSLSKGKTRYLNFIPGAVKRLQKLLRNENRFPALKKCAAKLHLPSVQRQ